MVTISTKTPLIFISFCILLFSIIDQTLVESKQFKCTSNIQQCKSIVEYISPNTTTITTIQSLFNVENLTDILGVNNLPLSTPSTYTIQSRRPIKIPIPCLCSNGTGKSNKVPVYKVVKDDGLYHIAFEIFSGLIVFQEIQEANNISDANKILVGQELWIPLPCSCDEVDGERVVHYGFVVPPRSTVAGIAAQYNTTQDVLLRLNDLASANDLKAEDVIDVPLRACASSISENSRDYPLLVSNGTYALTAQGCVRCKCDAANNYTLQCEPSQFNSSVQRNCSPLQCQGSGSLFIGNSTSSGCDRATCSYSGYNRNGTILTTLEQSTCPAPGQGNNASKFNFNIWRMSFIIIAFHLMLFCIQFT
ncbi:hypothetical protein Leryth_004534 [Lithospermum erythrorhizon]|nr:hypothetical protein Leryth_004534 [Lithospermum erythrorhizon]